MATTFVRSTGFGITGISVGATGYTYHFHKAVARVRIHNAGSVDMAIGVNADITDGSRNLTGTSSSVDQWGMVALTAAAAKDDGILVKAGTSIDLDFSAGTENAHRIFSVWAITASGTTTMAGGVIGY